MAKAESKAAKAKAALCAAEGRLWMAHLRKIRSKQGTSFLERNGGRDHFFARNRAWFFYSVLPRRASTSRNNRHYASPRTAAEDAAAAAAREDQGDCCEWSHARGAALSLSIGVGLRHATRP